MELDQVELLTELLERHVAEYGPDALFAKQLEQQIASMKRVLSGKVTENPVVMTAHFESYGDQEDD